VDAPLLSSVVEAEVVLVVALLVPLPVDVSPLVLLLGCEALLPPEVKLLGPVELLEPDEELLTPEVVAVVSVLAPPLGPPESVEHEATNTGTVSRGTTTHEAVERNEDKYIFVMVNRRESRASSR
jgi:hypothetical protein